jgi:hypothetical protein
MEGSCEPSGSIKCWEFLKWLRIGSFSRRAQLHELVSEYHYGQPYFLL